MILELILKVLCQAKKVSLPIFLCFQEIRCSLDGSSLC